MSKQAILIFLIFFAIKQAKSQQFNPISDYIYLNKVGVGKQANTTTNNAAWLEIGKDSTTKGLLLPRVVDTVNIIGAVKGLFIYQIKDNQVYYRDKFAWQRVNNGIGYLKTSDSTIFYPFWSNPRGFINTESDPVANAKTITLTPGSGISISVPTKTIGSNPSYTINATNGNPVWNAQQLQNSFVSPSAPTTGQFLVFNGSSWTPTTVTTAGTVTSVGLSLPTDIYNVSGSPITGSGTLVGTFKNQLANLIWASPNGTSGAPTFRSLTSIDLPASGVGPGTYGDDTSFTTFAVNNSGNITNANTNTLTLDRVLRGGNMSSRAIALTNNLNLNSIDALHLWKGNIYSGNPNTNTYSSLNLFGSSISNTTTGGNYNVNSGGSIFLSANSFGQNISISTSNAFSVNSTLITPSTFNTRIKALRATEATDLVRKDQLDSALSGASSSTLQTVTNSGNVTSNTIGITGADNISTSINGLQLLYGGGATIFSGNVGAGTYTPITLSGSGLTFNAVSGNINNTTSGNYSITAGGIVDLSSSLAMSLTATGGLTFNDGLGTPAFFSIRTKGQKAIFYDELVRKDQLDSVAALTTSGGVTTLQRFTTDMSNGVAGSSVSLYNYNIPANTLITDGQYITATYGGLTAMTGATTRTIQIVLNGNGIGFSDAIGGAAGFTVNVTMIRVNSTTLKIVADYGKYGAGYYTYNTANFSSPISLDLQGTSTSAMNDIVAKFGIIQLYP